MSFNDIPEELRLLNQWVVWRAEDVGSRKSTKVPYDPKTGKLANVNWSSTWSDFNTGVKVCANDYSGIGFVFTHNDPYTFIDLDDTQGDAVALERQLKVFHEFDSYSEISPSGKGLHIIIKGAVTSGRRRSFIELYSSGRYATFTGNVYNAKPIMERQELLQQLFNQMGTGGAATKIFQGDDAEKDTDDNIIQQARLASNGQKFIALYDAKWDNLYASQSEADFALIDIIAFYTQNKNQIERIFHKSKLGKRDKAKRKDYLAWMINKSFDRMLPQLDFDGFKNALEEKLASNVIPFPNAGHDQPVLPIETPQRAPTSIAIPSGLMGELAQFIYAAAPRPVPEIALAGAIGLMAGICGRAYNVSATGLNQYVLCLAQTGTGKEAMAHGIDKIMNAIRLQVPTSSGFIGPSEIASGQALIKHLSKTSQCFVSILGEFGIRLETLSSERANSSEKALKRMLLDLYNKSGHGQVFRPSIFADADKNIQSTEAPAFSILGESTPERFYNALNEEMISEGLLPRFMLIEYSGPRPSMNENHVNVTPPFMLIEKFASLVANCEMIMHAKRVINVKMDDTAVELFHSFDRYADSKINATNQEVLRQLWNRAHIKALKIAALIAVGVNMSDPLIIEEYVKWSIDMVQNDIRSLANKFELGEIGHSSFETKQNNDILRLMKEFLTKDWDYITKYCQGRNMDQLHKEKIVPYAYLNKRAVCLASFRNDRQGATPALKRALQNMVEGDILREANKADLAFKCGTSQRAFVVSNPKILDDIK